MPCIPWRCRRTGRFWWGGLFFTLGGQSRVCLGRLNADGTLDTTFNPETSYEVDSLAVQADGKILVAGQFSTLGGQSRTGVGRLNADGTLDARFNPGANASALSLAVQADGAILAGGYFTKLGGQSRNYIGRLNADGTLDTSFNPGAGGGAFPQVLSLAVQADGKVLVGGAFTELAGQSRTNIGRLNADGTLDTSFNPGTDGEVNCLAVQADGMLLVGGGFTMLGGQSRTNIGRLNADGTLDTSFNPGTDGHVNSLALQGDGTILVGGQFRTLGGQSRICIGRLNADGTLDTSFNPGAGAVVYALAEQADGKILVGGFFSTLAGQSRNCIGRLNNTEPATQSLTFDGSTLAWMRGGTSPEVWRTTFEYLLNGASWTNLGAGSRIPGGWQLTGLVLPANTTFRARGYTVGGVDNASGWFAETIIGPLVISEHPASLTNNAGTNAEFTVYAGGSGPLSYQWRNDGANLADGGNVSGAASANLSLSDVLHSDEAGYSVVISNAYGSVTSAVATLTVIDPVIIAQPAGQIGILGDSITLSLVAAGTAPLSYQWRKDGGVLAGATQSSLTLTNLQEADAGSYDVLVSNAWGDETSATALLSVIVAGSDSFNPGAGGTNRTSPYVASLAVQADGQILVGGDFTTLGGQSRICLGRLSADGTLDTSFNPGAEGAPYLDVHSLALQDDGKILAAGWFTTLGGQSRNYIGRLNADGTLDPSFNPGPNDVVYSLAVQADRKILVGGRVHDAGRAEPHWHWPAQRRRNAGHRLRSGCGRRSLFARAFPRSADGWEDSGRAVVQPAGRPEPH